MTNPRDARHDGPSDGKGVLFCPDCDHRSALDGDWDLRAGPDAYEYRCPECGASVLNQPVLGPETDPRPAAETPDSAGWVGALTRAAATWSDWVSGLSLPVGLGGR